MPDPAKPTVKQQRDARRAEKVAAMQKQMATQKRNQRIGLIDTFVGPDGEKKVAQSPECKQAIQPNIAATAIDVMKGVMTSGNQVLRHPDPGAEPGYRPASIPARSARTLNRRATSPASSAPPTTPPLNTARNSTPSVMPSGVATTITVILAKV